MKNALGEKRARTIIRKPVRIEAADEIELLPMMKNRSGTRTPRHETQKLYVDEDNKTIGDGNANGEEKG